VTAYSKAKLKGNDDKASPCFRPFWIWMHWTNLCLWRCYYRFHL